MDKVLLCFGDSNTWGFIPVTRERYGRAIRWPGVMAGSLGPGYHVIEEGLNGRTTVFDDPVMEGRRGLDYLRPCLESHRPVDLLIVMLGTNDAKSRFAASALDIARGMAVLLEHVRGSGAAEEVLLISPPHLGPFTDLAEMFRGAEAVSRNLAARYREVAVEFGCHFLDASTLVSPSALDGIHLDAEAHQSLGLAVAGVVRKLLRVS